MLTRVASYEPSAPRALSPTSPTRSDAGLRFAMNTRAGTRAHRASSFGERSLQAMRGEGSITTPRESAPLAFVVMRYDDSLTRNGRFTDAIVSPAASP